MGTIECSNIPQEIFFDGPSTESPLAKSTEPWLWSFPSMEALPGQYIEKEPCGERHREV